MKAIRTESLDLTQLPELVRGDAVIEASAGTGKTYTLERWVGALVEAGAPIESILVVTFTDKATREMRGRIRRRLEERAGARATESADPVDGRADDEVVRARLRTALAAFDRAPISTIHTFARRILVEHAFETDRMFGEQRIDLREIFREAFGRSVREGLAHGRREQGLYRALLARLGERRLEEQLFRASEERDALAPRFDRAAVVRALVALAPESPESLAQHVVREPRRGWALAAATELLAIARRVREAHVSEAARADHDPPGAALEGELSALVAWGELSYGSSRDVRSAGVLREATVDDPTLGPHLAVLEQAFDVPLVLAATELLPGIQAEVRRRKSERGLFVFDDLLDAFAAALEGPSGPALATKIRARFRHALVDEFQDTDATQWSIFRTLFAGPREEVTAGELPSTLVVIGDPKQAIYGFRRADVYTYREAVSFLVERGARAFHLDRTYRASPALVSGLHAIFDVPASTSGGTGESPDAASPLERPRDRYFHGINRYDAPVEAAQASLAIVDDADVEAAPLVVWRGSPKLGLRALRRAHARAIATEIRGLLRGELRRRDAKGAVSPIQPRDIFVLVRTSAEAREVADALRREAISFVFTDKDSLFSTREAEELLTVLRALVAPHDRRARHRAFLTPFFGLSLDEIVRVDELPSDHVFVRRLFQLAELGRRRDLPALFHALAVESGYVARQLYLSESERSLTNTLHLIELLSGLSHEVTGLPELVLRLASLIHDEDSFAADETTQRLESERDAVQILTYHKSKGLEAEVVFLYGGWTARAPQRGDVLRFHRETPTGPERVAWIGPRDPRVAQAIEAADREEAERLLYVALTRAKTRLYLTRVEREPTKGEERGLVGEYRVVDERLAELVASASPLIERRELPSHVRRRPPPPTMLAGLTTPGSPSADVASMPIAPSDDAALLASFAVERERFAGPSVTSYSRMKSLELAKHAPDDDVKLEVALEDVTLEDGALEEGLASSTDEPLERPALDDGLPGGAAFGVLVHTLLEELDPLRVASAVDAAAMRADPDLESSIERAFSMHAITPPQELATLELVRRTLLAPIAVGEAPARLELPAGLATVRVASREMPFLFPIPEVGHRSAIAEVTAGSVGRLAVERGFIRGVIDLLFEHEGRLYVLDWKTDRLPRFDVASLGAHVSEHYSMQRILYVLATLRAFGVRGRAAYEARFGGLVYVFLRGLAQPGEGVHFELPRWDEVERWEEELRASASPFGYPLPKRRAQYVGALASLLEAPVGAHADEEGRRA